MTIPLSFRTTQQIGKEGRSASAHSFRRRPTTGIKWHRRAVIMSMKRHIIGNSHFTAGRIWSFIQTLPSTSGCTNGNRCVQQLVYNIQKTNKSIIPIRITILPKPRKQKEISRPSHALLSIACANSECQVSPHIPFDVVRCV